MGKKEDIVIRFSIVSGDRVSISDLEEVLKLLPKPESSYIMGQQRILTNGKTIVNNETTINFRSGLKVFDLKNCNKEFVEYWQPYAESLKTITNIYGYELLLNYEITVYDLHYPSFVFDTEFLSFLSGLGMEFSMYFYND
jgi:hypothetical protein